jgi:hypothetical protein
MRTGRKLKKRTLKPTEMEKLGQCLRSIHPALPFRLFLYQPGNEPLLSHITQPLSSVELLDGRKFSAGSLSNGIVKARAFEPNYGGWVERVGEITDIWQHMLQDPQGHIFEEYFARMRWYKRSTIWAPRCISLWSKEL